MKATHGNVFFIGQVTAFFSEFDDGANIGSVNDKAANDADIWTDDLTPFLRLVETSTSIVKDDNRFHGPVQMHGPALAPTVFLRTV